MVTDEIDKNKDGTPPMHGLTMGTRRGTSKTKLRK